MSDYGTLRRHGFAVPFELVMLSGAVVTYLKADYLHLLTSVFTFTISFAPLLVERWLKVRLPVWLQTAYVAFVFASMFAGEVFGMYGRIWQWDDMAHVASGLLLGLGTIITITELKRRRLFTGPFWLQILLVICVGMAVAVLWETAEFASDQLFGTSSQNGDLKDTMLDLIDDSTGALVIACMYGVYLKNKRGFGLRRIIKNYERLNS
jgi:uncharacterized membrane protein YjdF